ncbi:MAG TPA: FGGY family carbohydrate kinase, partial [Acidimicrobiales bacterium]|nr:FGGY family carbohydrate kinase [Acidimicrobiales bacterium]
MDRRALALDLGSSSVRAVVFETGGPGRLVAVDGALARRPRHMSSPEPGQATFVADSYLADLVACIDELGDNGYLEGVDEVGMDCQMHSVVPLDATGRPLAEVVAWADTRARPPAGAAAIGPDRRESLRQRTGCAFAPTYWTWRVPWLTEAVGAGALTEKGGFPARFLGLSEYVGLALLNDPT